MNCTLHDELTENGTDISEIVTENETTPDIQNIDPLICGENFFFFIFLHLLFKYLISR
jgi:hypothetical protein